MAAADKLHGIGKTEHAESVRQLIREWAAADDAGLRASAAYALGRRSGQMEPAEAAALLTALAAQAHSLVVAAVTRACMLAAAGEAADDPRGVWVFGMLQDWIGHRDGRVRRAAGRVLMAMAADLEREADPRFAVVEYAMREQDQELASELEPSDAAWADRSDRRTQGPMNSGPRTTLADSAVGSPASSPIARDRVEPARIADIVAMDGQTGDPDSSESRHPAGRPGPGAPEEGPAPWPGLVWFGALDPETGRSVAALWRAALVSPEFARQAGRALDLCAHRVEPYPERREALVRLAARIAAGWEYARGAVVLRARHWVGRPDSGAPLTGALLLAVLDPAYAAARIEAGGHLDPEADNASCERMPPPRHADRAQQHRVRNTTRPPRRISGRNPTHDHRSR